jgi:hypothetical protein
MDKKSKRSKNEAFKALFHQYREQYVSSESISARCLLLRDDYERKGVCICGGTIFSKGRWCQATRLKAIQQLTEEAHILARIEWGKRLEEARLLSV